MSDQTPLRFHKFVASHLPEGSRGDLLNAGCGTGNLNQIGLPHTIHNCDLRSRDLPNFRTANLNERWPYQDEKFDVVISTEVIEHVENPWHFMREVKRVMKRNGVALITTPNNESERAKRAFQRTGSFPWFQYEHVWSQLRHITPIFSWQMHFICNELHLMRREFTYSPEEDMQNDNWIFEIKRTD